MLREAGACCSLQGQCNVAARPSMMAKLCGCLPATAVLEGGERAFPSPCPAFFQRAPNLRPRARMQRGALALTAPPEPDPRAWFTRCTPGLAASA